MMVVVLVVEPQCVYAVHDAGYDDGGGVEAGVGSGVFDGVGSGVGDIGGSSGDAVVDDVESSHVGVGGATDGGE